MNISRIFIHRPVATTLLTLGLALAGVVAFRFLPVSPLPRIDFPTIYVSAGLPGADPETMATSVAAPLERQLGHIAGLTEMTSVSARGTTAIVLQFDLDRNIDGAARDVQAAINAARGYLPPNLPNNPIYRKVNPSEAPIMIIGLTSDSLFPAQMYDAASTILQQKLSQVDGVGQVFVGGGSLPAVRVELNPMTLNKYGINLRDLRGVLTNTNANRPKGQIMDSERTWGIDTNDQLRKAWEYRDLIVSYRSGAAVKLTDVADVQDSVEDLRAGGLINGKPAVSVIVFRQPGANIIDTVDRVRELIPQLTASMPGGIQIKILQDRTPSIRGSLKEVERALIIAVLLVVLVVFLFLRNVRSTLIPGTAVAVSIIGTFAIMYLCGFSLDNLSLMALTISTGFVVDDAIVVLENITRHMEKGTSALKAALEGSREIAFTVLSMSISLIAVFIPILLMGGIVGRLFREFAITLSVAILISLALSLTTTPMMCATLLKSGVISGTDLSRPRKRRWLYRASESAFNRMHALYETSLRWALRHPRFMLTLTLSMVALSIALFIIVPKGFFPEQDTGRISGIIMADQSTSFQAMQKKMAAIVDLIKGDPDVENVSAYTGGGTGTNQARMFIALKSERKASAQEVIGRLRRKLFMVPGAPSYLQPVQDLRVGGRMGGALYQYTLQGENLPELNLWASRLLAQMRGLKEITDVNSDQMDKGLQVSVVIDRDTASRFNIRPALIDEALYDAFGQRQVSINYTLLNQYHVVMEVEPRYWQHPETLRDIYVTPANGAAVPLSAFARFERTSTPLTVNHQSQFPASTISFNLAPNVALGDAVTKIEKAQQQMGMPASIRGNFQGTAKAFQASLANQPLLILAALVAVYIVLGILYESYIHPITILSTLPSAGVGAVLALIIFGTDLSVIAIIGIILLIGLVKKNGIMMVDFALEAERKEGKSPMESIYQACLLRFRPIMMTTMAAMLGALPLALGTGVGSELRRPLGISIIGGLIVSQMLTLYTTPVIYLYMDRFRIRLERRRQEHRTHRLPLLLIGVVALSSIFLTSCTIGPKYTKPTAPVPVEFKEAKGWKAAQPMDHMPRGKWWEAFNDSELNALAEQINVSNLNIALYEAQYRQAVELVKAARAGYFPVVSAAAQYDRASPSYNSTSAAPGIVTSVYSLPLTATWELDIWGKVRKQVEAQTASTQASAADLEGIRLSVQASLAQAFFQLRALDGQKQLLDQTIDAYRKSLELTQSRYASGVASRADVLQADTQLKTVQAQAIDIGVQRSQLEHAIALLCGKPPSELSIPPRPLTAQPPGIPSGIPSELLERRSDIAAAERRAAAANAQIGVAMTAYYPTLRLSAGVGLESSQIGNLISWPSRFWSLGPSLSETIFSGGLRQAQTAQARAVYDQTVAQYRQTVLTGFQEVEDNLAALRILSEEAMAQDAAVLASRQTLAVVTNQYKAGIVSYLNVVTAQATTLSNERSALDILQRRMNASVLLIKALGGGWDASLMNSADDRGKK